MRKSGRPDLQWERAPQSAARSNRQPRRASGDPQTGAARTGEL